MSSSGIFDFSLSKKSTEFQSLSKVCPWTVRRIDEDYGVMKPVFVVNLLLSHIVLSLTVVRIQNMIRRGKYILRKKLRFFCTVCGNMFYCFITDLIVRQHYFREENDFILTCFSKSPIMVYKRKIKADRIELYATYTFFGRDCCSEYVIFQKRPVV